MFDTIDSNISGARNRLTEGIVTASPGLMYFAMAVSDTEKWTASFAVAAIGVAAPLSSIKSVSTKTLKASGEHEFTEPELREYLRADLAWSMQSPK